MVCLLQYFNDKGSPGGLYSGSFMSPFLNSLENTAGTFYGSPPAEKFTYRRKKKTFSQWFPRAHSRSLSSRGTNSQTKSPPGGRRCTSSWTWRVTGVGGTQTHPPDTSCSSWAPTAQSPAPICVPLQDNAMCVMVDAALLRAAVFRKEKNFTASSVEKQREKLRLPPLLVVMGSPPPPKPWGSASGGQVGGGIPL